MGPPEMPGVHQPSTFTRNISIKYVYVGEFFPSGRGPIILLNTPYVFFYKGSAWVLAFAGTHTPGRAGQHSDLFDSIFNRE